MEIDELLEYVYSLERKGIKLGLDVMKSLLKALGNPEKDLKIIHIAGTNGKGSTAAMIESILRVEGYSTGLYTSPHLVMFNERIKHNNKDITTEELAFLVEKIKKVCEKKNIDATFFEFTTALALLHFAEKRPDYVILETGLGGRLDATNTTKPIVSIITNISIDHQDYLGRTLEEIAMEKAKIIKQGVPLITGEKDKKIIRLFKQECENNNSEYHNVNEEFKVKILESGKENQYFKANGEFFELEMLGEHQIENALVAIRCAAMLDVSKEAMVEGLKKASWPGRLEIISAAPLVIIDGAHNVEGVKTLRRFLHKNHPKCVIVFGVSIGKDYVGMLKELKHVAKKIIFTKGKYNGEDPKKLQNVYKKESVVIPNVKDALEEAMKNEKETIIVTGSIYMIGEAKESLLL
ncbi:MAG: folylpolyglutamate synthase/dihydrofolate synthase family protein [archaeon]